MSCTLRQSCCTSGAIVLCAAPTMLSLLCAGIPCAIPARMPQRALHLIAYDVAHPKRLRRALHIVRHHASGGQKSAHECWLTGTEKSRPDRQPARATARPRRPRSVRAARPADAPALPRHRPPAGDPRLHHHQVGDQRLVARFRSASSGMACSARARGEPPGARSRVGLRNSQPVLPGKNSRNS